MTEPSPEAIEAYLALQFALRDLHLSEGREVPEQLVLNVGSVILGSLG